MRTHAKGSKSTTKLAGRWSLATWGFVINGEWIEKGSMGWFGMSSDDKDNWPEITADILKSIRDDQYVTVVDCHI